MTTLQSYLLVVPYILSALISIGVSAYAFRRQRTSGALAFGYLALAETVWITGYILQSIAPTLEAKLFWNDLQFLGAVATPVAFFVFSLTYTRHYPRIPWSWRITFGVSAALVAFIWTDRFHHLFRTEPHLVFDGVAQRLVFTNGPLFHLYPLVAYSLLILGVYAVVVNYITAARVYRLQIATVLVGILIPWVTTIITWLEWVPLKLHEVTPLTFGVSNLIIAWALFKFGLFDLVPVAYVSLVERMEDGVIVLDNSGRILDINPAAQRILDLNSASWLGKPLANLRPPFLALFAGADETPVSLEMEFSVEGAVRYFEAQMTNLHDNRKQTNGYLVSLHDITQRKHVENRLREMAITDPLTGIFNRRHFFELADVEYARASRSQRSMAIILFDIDHFKQVNDTLGHAAGDWVLTALTRRCKENLRPYDTLARYGGEEFIVLLPDTGLDQAYQIGERLRSSISDEKFQTQAGAAAVTISLGIAALETSQVDSLDHLIDCADKALYAAKQRGRNQVYLSEAEPHSSPVFG